MQEICPGVYDFLTDSALPLRFVRLFISFMPRSSYSPPHSRPRPRIHPCAPPDPISDNRSAAPRRPAQPSSSTPTSSPNGAGATSASSAGTPAPFAKIAGLVERVTFHNGQNGFCVLRLKVKGERDLVTLVGHTPSVTPGEYATASGQWIVDREYGRQFKAEWLRIHQPTTATGIEKYLSSGMVKGIGPFFAKKLVQAFGTDVFSVIENEPNRLREIEGIGRKRLERITAGWASQKVIREIMVFLHGHGVSTSKSVRIYKTYGNDAVRVVQENPYRLAQDIRGIGFKSADTIAKNVGIDRHSPLRARAGISYTLLEASGNAGHCCLPRSELVQKAVELLDIPEDVIQPAIDFELESQRVVEDVFPEPGSVYPIGLYLAEEGVAKEVRRLGRGRLPWPAIDSEKAVPWVETKLGIRLVDSQRVAVSTALQSKFSIITGGPGVGKTTLVKSLLTILEAKHVRIQLCAPTGRAAKRLSESSGREAKTIHRLLEINPENGEFKRNQENPLECDLLVVDESSMIDIQLANHLLTAVPSTASVLIVGDVDQLPSVGPGAFLSDLIESHTVPVIRLTEVFRQAASSWIIKAAHRINAGQMPQFPTKDDHGDCYFVKVEETEEVAERIVDLVKRRLPKAYGVDPIRDIQVLCPMNRSGSGARALNLLLQEALNPPTDQSVERFGYKFGIGDKVMQIENNYDREVYNGDIGFVVRKNEEDETLTIDFDGREVAYDYADLDELVLCYATTIHKSQGSEYPIVVIPLSMQHFVMLKRNLVYTGVTRGKKLVVIVGQPRALGLAVRSNDALKRKTGLRARLIRQWSKG